MGRAVLKHACDRIDGWDPGLWAGLTSPHRATGADLLLEAPVTEVWLNFSSQRSRLNVKMPMKNFAQCLVLISISSNGLAQYISHLKPLERAAFLNLEILRFQKRNLAQVLHIVMSLVQCGAAPHNQAY